MRGKVWTFGDSINSDLLMPGDAIYAPREKQPMYCMSANRPGWAEQVEQGDILIAGHSFGIGSSRPAARVMKDLGLACVVAESINGLFFRNAVNFAFPALEVPGVAAAFEEGDVAVVDFDAARVRNERTGVELEGAVWPPELASILHAGGLVAQMVEEGLIAAPKG